MCVELLPSKRSENGFYVESVNEMAHARNALERKLEFNPIETNKKWPIPFKRQARSGIAQNFSIPCASTHARAVNTASGRWHPNIFPFACAVPVLAFLRFYPKSRLWLHQR